jgi:hypothetical protein
VRLPSKAQVIRYLRDLSVAVVGGLIVLVIAWVWGISTSQPQDITGLLGAFGIGFFGVLVGIEYVVRRAIELVLISLIILVLLVLFLLETFLHAAFG